MAATRQADPVARRGLQKAWELGGSIYQIRSLLLCPVELRTPDWGAILTQECRAGVLPE
jgi:hypothetical protein